MYVSLVQTDPWLEGEKHPVTKSNEFVSVHAALRR